MNKQKIHIETEDTLGAKQSPAQEARDAELAGTGVVPDEVLHESPEEADVVAESEAERVLPEDIAQLLERCEAAEKRAEEEHDNYIRALAEASNFRRRMKEELEQSRKYAVEDFALHLLPVLDNFERAIKAAEDIKSFEALHGGVMLILRQINEALEKEGVKQIDAEGQQFDPSVHEAVMREETDEYPENTVVEVFQKGYTLGDRVIRPSMVKVAVQP